MGSEFQSRGLALPRQGARELRAKFHRFELDLGLLRASKLLQRCCANDHRPMAVPTGPMEQGRGRLNVALPDPGLALLNNRTPDCFQRLVREPIVAAVEHIASVI